MVRFGRSRDKSKGRSSNDSSSRGRDRGRSRSDSTSKFSDKYNDKTGERIGGRGKSRSREASRDRKRSPSRSRRIFGREPSRNSKNRRDFEMTRAICASCNSRCEVPFKPTSDKPIYCSNCFSKNGKGRSDGGSSRDFKIINDKWLKKLNTII